jgi:hypothetical protein
MLRLVLQASDRDDGREDEQNLRECPVLIYTGNPGIGKSTWLNYALVRFVQDGYAVVLARAKTHDYFVFRDGIAFGRSNGDLIWRAFPKRLFICSIRTKTNLILSSRMCSQLLLK